MPIVESTVIEDVAQRDGRRWVTERHVDQVGEVYLRTYMAEMGVVISDGFPVIVAMLNAMLVRRELERDLTAIYRDGPLAQVTTIYATLADVRAALRVAYKTATRAEAYALGAFLDTLSDAQLANLFNIGNPSAELTALRARLDTKTAQWADYIAAAGE